MNTQSIGNIIGSNVKESNVSHTYVQKPDKAKGDRLLKWQKTILLLMCVTSLVFSVIALCRVYPYSPDFDYMGVIVGILSLLVTVLVTLNIYTMIDIKETKGEFDKYMRTTIDGKITNLYQSLQSYTDIQDVDTDTMMKEPAYAIELLVRSLNKILDKDYNDAAIKSAMNKLYVVCLIFHKDKLNIFKHRKNMYIMTISKTESPNTKSILEALACANETIDYPFND